MGARPAVWDACEGWIPLSALADMTGYARQTVAAAVRMMEAQGAVEVRFEDGIGTMVRRMPGSVRPPSSSGLRVGERARALLESGPMTTREMQEGIPQASPSAVLHALQRMEARGEAVRDRSREPHLWRLVR